MKTHPLNVSYLVIGLVFLAISGSWALRQVGVIDTEDVAWLGPVALIIAGGVGLVAAIAKGARKDRKSSYDTGYTPHYDAPLPQDYTSDLDRKLDEAQTAVVTTTEEAPRADGAPSDDDTDTTVIRTTEQDDEKDENR
jgi:hypothetical protein